MKKTAIITGGSRGIGYAIAKQLGLDGFQVAMFATGEKSRYEDQFKELTSLGIDWYYIKGSLDNTQDRKRLINEVLNRYKRIDVLVNNAGVAPLERKDLLEMTEESFDRVIEINTKGTMFITQLAAKQMLEQEIINGKRGTIINIGSCSAEVSSVSRGEYCISKAGVAMITKLYADKLAPYSIYVHEVRPGVIATDMTSTVKEKYNKMLEDGIFPIKRWGQPKDVANMVSLLCSDKVLYTTGNYIDVDGGFHIRRL